MSRNSLPLKINDFIKHMISFIVLGHGNEKEPKVALIKTELKTTNEHEKPMDQSQKYILLH